MAVSFFRTSAIVWPFNPLAHHSVLAYGVRLAWLTIVISRCLWAKMTSLARRKTSLRIGMRLPQSSYSSRYIFLDFSTTKTACPRRYDYSRGEDRHFNATCTCRIVPLAAVRAMPFAATCAMPLAAARAMPFAAVCTMPH